MEKSGFGIATDVKKEGDEVASFPILCETCLGDNPYVRMIRQHSGKECKICCRPYTVFRWKPGPAARFKQTIVCQTCAKLKNICQTCLFDLEYGLPVQVRDKFLAEAGGGALAGDSAMSVYNSNTTELTQLSNVNRNYLASQLEKQESLYGMNNSQHALPNPHLARLARSSPYYRRNAPRVCSFWLKGECTRGATCPYLHRKEIHDPALAKQNIKDRYAGVDDPVAEKIFRQNESSAVAQSMLPPDDKSITALFLKNIDTYRISENDIRDEFYAYGEIKSIRINRNNNTAFVNYATRSGAEAAMEALHSSLCIKNCRIRLSWAFAKTKDGKEGEEEGKGNTGAGEGLGMVGGMYASMNPAEAEHRR